MKMKINFTKLKTLKLNKFLRCHEDRDEGVWDIYGKE
jgi:hypothetical protein